MLNSPIAVQRRHHLILIHGGGVGPWMWRAQRSYFEYEFSVHTPTLPGHDPTRPDHYTTRAAAAESIAKQVHLAQLEGTVSVIGFSLGGQIAIELSSMFPSKIQSTVVVSSLLRPRWGSSLTARVGASAAPLTRARRFARLQARQLRIPADQFDAYFELTRTMSKETFIRMLRSNLSFQVPTEFRESRRPVLIMVGSREQSRLKSDALRLTRLRSNTQYNLITGVGHSAPISVPEDFNTTVHRWLQKVQGYH
ncbi:alpha/beta fold hydrolase [Glutamicibacter ardleyensis]|uniref:alpha/beta fold hydrolase n=1 Tax=Glutamicibacter ardleyensis TaxID=225894 RepID=UPI003FD51251